MKYLKIIFPLACLLVLTSSCNKNEELMEKLFNVWNLEAVSGGFSGAGYDADWDQIEFTNKSKYAILKNGGIISAGSFNINSANTEDDFDELKLNPNGSSELIFESQKLFIQCDENGDLFLSHPCCDLFTYQFKN